VANPTIDVILHPDLAVLYARALVEVARGDHEISSEEGAELQARLAARCGDVVGLDDVLLAPRLHVDELVAIPGDGPFRSNAVDSRTLGLMLVEDGLAVVNAKGGGDSAELLKLRHFAAALGLSDAELAAIR
jgi:hypothetical protein